MLASSWTVFATTVALLSEARAELAVQDGVHWGSTCAEFVAPVWAKATNVANVTLDSPGSGDKQVEPAPFDLFFRFCTPSRPTRRSKTLQILAHGGTYTHEYWNIKYKPEMYSYERAALAQGYSTLSYDNLGSGKSSKPDPFNVVQMPLLFQLAAGIVQAVHGGTFHNSVPKYNKIIYVGHSLGSMILDGALAAAPDLPIDAAVFTGYRHLSPPIYTPTVARGEIQIASQAFPDRFGSLSDGYVVVTNRSGFYGPPGSYEEGAFDYDTRTQNLFTVGNAFTADRGFVAAPGFRGHVLAVAGEQDARFCAQQPPGCPILSEENAFYPNAASFEAHVIPNTGHVLNLHKSSLTTYGVIFDWLTRKGF